MEFYHGIDRPEKANIKDRGGRLCGHGGAGELQGHCREDARQDQLRHHPQRAGGSGGDGLSGAAPHLRRPGSLRQGLPALRQRTHGAPCAAGGGGREHPPLPHRENVSGGSGDGPSGPDGLQHGGLPRLCRGGPHPSGDGAAVRPHCRGR